jgi:lipoate-protein ligase B
MLKGKVSRHSRQKRVASEANVCQVYDLGIVDYEKSLHLQNRLVSARIAAEISDTLLFLQHPSVLTIGASGNEGEIIVPKDLLAQEKIATYNIDRGGGITYHGPGQLVGYPIIDLRTKGIGTTQYVRHLEEVIIRTLAAFSLKANRDPKYPGVWVGQDKICALGIRVIHWVTMHGFALNVNTDLKYFTYITPCGIIDRQVTSMSQLLGRDVALDDVLSCIIEHWAQVFDMTIEQGTLEELSHYVK